MIFRQSERQSQQIVEKYKCQQLQGSIINKKINIQMLHPTDQNQQGSSNKSIKLSTNVRNEPLARTLKSTIVNYKDSISHAKINDSTHNRSMNLQRKESGTDNSSHKLDKMIAHQKQINNNWNKEIENQRQSLLATSRQIKRISTEFDQTIHRSNQKSLHFSQNKGEFKSPILRKDESQYTRTSQNIHNESLGFQEKANYQMQIQQLMNKVQFLENQCRNLRNQNDHLHRSLGAPKQILQREIDNKNFRIEDVEKRLATKNKQYLEKCVENQRNMAKVTDLESGIRKLEGDKQKLNIELQKSNQNGVNLSKVLNDSRAKILQLENEKKKVCIQLDGEKLKVTNLEQEKKQVELELQKISKIKDLVREMEQSDTDKADVIKKHIAYEAQLIELNGVMVSNLESHKHDLKVTSDQHQNINKQIESITNQIAVKMKDVLEQKQRLEDELAEARAETEKIRKVMFIGYQQIIAKLKDEIIQLKQQNVNLSNNSQSKITIVKLQREIKLLETKNEDLMNRHKQMEGIIQKLQATDLRRTAADISSETSIKGPEYYDRTGKTDLESIIMSYETRSIDLNERIHEKQVSELQLKRKVEELENQLRQLKDQAQFSTRKQKSDNDNVKAKLESMKMQLKSETDSLNRKIEALQKNIQRKNREIKQKDNFITHYLIQKVKDQTNVDQIVQEIDKFFVETA